MHTQISTQSPSSLLASNLSERRRAFIALIVLVWAVIYVGSLFQPPLMDDADTVHAEAAREMVETGDWVTLKINGGLPLPGKSAAHVLVRGCELQNLWRA